MFKTCRLLFCSVIFLCWIFFVPAQPLFAYTFADDASFKIFNPGSRINDKVESAINAVLKYNKSNKNKPSASEISTLLEYMLVVDGSGSRVHPAKRSEGMGVYWRGTIGKPFEETLRYFYNTNIPSELLYPSSLRQGHWLPGSDILNLQEPIWEVFKNLGDEPVVLHGTEFEEITPDNNSGCYYSYKQKRTLVLLRYQDVPVLLSLSWQDGKSSAGMKANFLGDYDNWDFVYTAEVGGTAAGLGWMSTYMYSSVNITAIFPKNKGETCYAMFKWLKAGWSGINVVKREHITSGADRNFAGMLEVISGKNSISVKELEDISIKYDALERTAMLQEAAPYAMELAKRSKNDEILNRDEFQEVLAGGIYAEKLSDDELRSLLKVLALKRKLGKPILGEIK